MLLLLYYCHFAPVISNLISLNILKVRRLFYMVDCVRHFARDGDKHFVRSFPLLPMFV
ncbi:hypothetical protein EZS27_013878 [termite gut metagenome]|uniref:Uncharacterized protein n=1 Tax=termite gut metagenome TaxID=433724 RepID=A0A5J4RX95_9ZZZZ